MTNKEFEQLSEEEKISYFESLAADDVESLTQLQKSEYDSYVGSKDGDEEASIDPYEIGKKYFEDNPSLPYNELFVITDGTVFYGGMRGKNLANNYVTANSKDINPLSVVTVKRD